MTSANLTLSASVQRPSYQRFRPIVVVVYAILAIVVILSLYPFAMMLINSFKSDTEILANPAALPRNWTLDSYNSIFTFHNGVWGNFLNSVIIAVTSTVTAVLMTSMAAFAFSKYRFRGRNALFTLLMLTLMVPSQITIPPLF